MNQYNLHLKVVVYLRQGIFAARYRHIKNIVLHKKINGHQRIVNLKNLYQGQFCEKFFGRTKRNLNYSSNERAKIRLWEYFF